MAFKSMNYHEQLEEILKLVDGQDAYQRLVALFLQGPEEARDLIRAKWDFRFKWVNPEWRLISAQNFLAQAFAAWRVGQCFKDDLPA